MFLPIDSKNEIEVSAPAFAKDLYNCTCLGADFTKKLSSRYAFHTSIQALKSANVRRVTATSRSLKNYTEIVHAWLHISQRKLNKIQIKYAFHTRLVSKP